MKVLIFTIMSLLISSLALAQSPELRGYDPGTGQFDKYLGDLNQNQFDPNSISNPYGPYGSRFSPDSINNPFGQYGSRFSPLSPTNPFPPPRPIAPLRPCRAWNC